MAQHFVRKGGNKQLCVIHITQYKHHKNHRPRTSSEGNIGERGSYKQRKENQSRKQYSLRSNAKKKQNKQKEESGIGSSATSNMSAENQPQQWEQIKSLCVPKQLALI